MTSNADATTGLGYAYPSGGFLLRLKNSLNQFDLFSEFNKYLSPAPHHDRCERSLHMRLYTLTRKREFVMVFLGFFTCFGLSIIIGLTGPSIINTTESSVFSEFVNTSLTKNNALATLKWPKSFAIKSPLLSTYSQQLWVIAQLSTENNDDEIYHKSFHISVSIEGLTKEHKPLNILKIGTHNRTRNLICNRNQCDEFTVMHLGFLEYAHYIITVNFLGLDTFHQKYNIKNVKFYFRTYNPEFTQIEIWFRFIFVLLTFIVVSWYWHTLRKFPIHDWSIEQKWMSVLLPLLIMYDNPFFPTIFLWNSWFPGFLDAILQATFLCALLVFFLCIYHSLRQNERNFVRFYFPKVVVVSPIWLCAVVLATWEKCNEFRDPTYSHFVDVNNYNVFKMFFYISGAMYTLYLTLLVLKAYSDLRSMPVFNIRLKFLTILMLFVLAISIAITTCRFGFGILEDTFVATLSTRYNSAVQFMSFYGLLNFYLYTMAFVYSPNLRLNSVTKDNPAFSMINDSDEEVIYGSDDESKQPLTVVDSD